MAVLATVNELLSSQGLLLKRRQRRGRYAHCRAEFDKNKEGKRDPEMHSSKKANQWHFGMKAHIGVDADSGLVHSVRGTAGHVTDVTEGSSHAAWR